MGYFDDLDAKFGKKAPKRIVLDTFPDEGSDCVEPKCRGKYKIELPGSCYCAVTHAPCSNCENSFLVCSECGHVP
jgi:hypothetical protein